jgi:gliding motility-associated-like protein
LKLQLFNTTINKKMKLNLLLFSFTFLSLYSISQCEVFTSASQYEIFCGESVSLTAFGQSNGTVVLSEDFNTGGFGAGWGSTPGSTSFSNPCSPGGVDGTPHAWMDNNTTVPRTLQSASYDLSAATAGVTICFDLLFASQGDASPCEGPDEPDEGVYLEYSIDGGATWIQITYFDPNGGNDPQLTNWNNWCFQVPAAAITPNTMFRWHQTADSGADYDHWGIDNVEIYQNDISAELEWIHDGYSYGVGNPGGTNPTDVTPTSTTTYTAQLTTGGGIVCTQDVTIVVLDPVYDVNVTLAPTTICQGDCADFTGDASWVIDPGGIETYENNQLEIVATGSASVNINIQDLNMTTVDPGSIQEICINGFNFSGTELCTNFFGGCNCNGTPISFGDNCNIDASSFNITVTSPNGCVITLVPSGELTATGIQDMCFVPAGGAPLISGSGNYTGQFDPTDPISNLDGCDANGVWTLEFNTGTGGFGFGFGSLTGWNITFDDPPVVQPVNTVWSPTTGLTDPNSLNTQACPNTTTTYTLEVDNGVPGCATYTEDFTLTVDPCGGCIPPVLDIDPIFICSPNNADLNDAINPSSDPATITFHGTQADAQNDVNTISNSTGATGSYWVRAEDPLDPTCFEVYEIEVTVTTVAYNANVTDENCGNLDGELDLTASGGTAPYTYSIDNGLTSQGTGLFNGLSAGSYDIVITDNNGCEVTGTEVVGNIGGPTIDAITPQDPTCAGDCDGEITVTVSGGTLPYTYQWLDNLGNPIGTNAASITGLCAGDYSIEVNDASGACAATDNATLNDPAPEDPSFTLNDFCVNAANNATITGDAGGTFSFNPLPGDGASIDALTGEISDGVNGTTYFVEYTTGGPCPESSIQTVSVTGFSFVSNVVDENCGNLDGEIDLVPNGGVAPYTFSIDNGATFQPNGTFTNLSAGIYTVVIIDDNGCEATGTANIANIGGPSIVTIDALDPSCAGLCDGEITVTINGGTLPYTYQWLDQFGNPVGTNSNTISALCAGDYSIEVTDAASGACPASASMSLTDPLNDDPSFDFVGFCEGGLNAPSSIVTPGGTFSFDPDPLDGAVIDATTGEISNGIGGTSYSVVYTTPGACPQQATVIVDVIPGPTFTLSQVNPGCGTADGEIIISDLTPNTNYELTYVENGTTQGPANFTSDVGGSIILSGLSAGNFSDFLVDLNGCSTFDNSVLNLVNANAPSITAPADISICVGESVTLTALNPDNALINWDNGVTDDVPFTPGIGTIIYTVSADLNGCIATDQVTVIVNALPIVNAGADVGVCEGDDLTLSGNGANSYVWNNGVVDGVAFTPGATATYTVIGTDINGCVRQDDVTVTVNELPTVDFVGDPRSGCAPLLVDFRNLSGANNASCTWELGDGTTIVGCDDFSHVYQNEGNYSITLTVESNEGCTNSLTFLNYINVTGPPEALFSADPQVTDISNTFVNFTNESTGGVDFTWDFGDGSDNEFGYNASHEFPNENSGTYVVTLIASEGTDCADTVRLVIQINDVLIFYVPNTFTPDDDPFNPIFIPVFGSGLDESDYELIIFNRWGEVVFETRDLYEGWDGTYKGQPVKDGTYVWKLEFLETMSDKRHSYHGHVNVLR